jgi:hypothetical protein
MKEFIKQFIALTEKLSHATGFEAVAIIDEMERLYQQEFERKNQRVEMTSQSI